MFINVLEMSRDYRKRPPYIALIKPNDSAMVPGENFYMLNPNLLSKVVHSCNQECKQGASHNQKIGLLSRLLALSNPVIK